MIHAKLRQHLTFGYSEFPSLLELGLTASALSFAAALLQDHPGASFCTDLIGRLLRCPSAFPPSLLAGPLPHEDEMQANAAAELGTCAALCSVLCLVGTEQELVICNSGCVYVAHLGKSGYDSGKAAG